MKMLAQQLGFYLQVFFTLIISKITPAALLAAT